MSKAKDVSVEVHIDEPDANPPKFRFTSNDLTVGPDNELTFKDGTDHSGFDIHFKLAEPRRGYYFPGPAIPGHLDEALYVSPGRGCPKSAHKWEQFEAVAVNGRNTELTVHNKNKFKAEFGYTLRVTNDNGASYLALDPIGTNQNGNVKNLSLITASVVGVAGAVAGALAVKAAMPMASQSAIVAAALGVGVLAAVIYLMAQNRAQQPA